MSSQLCCLEGVLRVLDRPSATALAGNQGIRLSGGAKWTEGFGVWLTFDGDSWHFGSCVWVVVTLGKGGRGGGDSCRGFEVGE